MRTLLKVILSPFMPFDISRFFLVVLFHGICIINLLHLPQLKHQTNGRGEHRVRIKIKQKTFGQRLSEINECEWTTQQVNVRRYGQCLEQTLTFN